MKIGGDPDTPVSQVNYFPAGLDKGKTGIILEDKTRFFKPGEIIKADGFPLLIRNGRLVIKKIDIEQRRCNKQDYTRCKKNNIKPHVS